MEGKNNSFDVVCNEVLLSRTFSDELLKPNAKCCELQSENYKIYDNRINSFKTWPISEKIDPSMIAKAGLYYSGYNDLCICPWCGVKLKKWEYFDNPHKEHKKFAKKCAYLLMVMPNE